MAKFDPLQNLMTAAEAHVFSEAELRLLALMAIKSATDLLAERHYNESIAAIDDAIGHIRALREKEARK